ncbi:MAG: Clp protease N-terminal domain-containing protein [Planctomycetota bacterium]
MRHATYEMYSDDIRDTMLRANREAKRRGHTLIGTHHVLIGMWLEPTGLAGMVLRRCVSEPGHAIRQIRRLSPPRRWRWLRGKLTMSDGLQRVVDLAVEYAQDQNHASVGTGGVLLAMLQHDSATRDLLGQVVYEIDALQATLTRHLREMMVEAPGEPVLLDAPGLGDKEGTL